jgi:hypothetical protein
MCTRAMDDAGVTSFNSVYQNTKSQNFVILDPKNGDFGPLAQKKQYEGTYRHTVRYWRRAALLNTVLSSSGTGG